MADFLAQRLAKLRAAGQYRQLAGSVEGIDFWSNDYLGLARHGALSRPDAVAEQAGGATGSRLISGDADSCHALEASIAAYHGFPAALVFNAGYSANLGLLSAILKRGDVVLYDELMHASCRDGLRLGQAQGYKFKHNCLEEALRRIAARERQGQLFVLTEGRFSMDGDLAPLTEMASLCQAHGAHLIVDEAHSGGLEGPGGAGLVAALGLQDQVFANIITFGKAFGSHGAAVLGASVLRDYLINTARPFIYTTAPAPAQWRGIAAAYTRLRQQHGRLYPQLLDIIARFRAAMVAAGFTGELAGVTGPIQVLRLPGNAAVMAAETACREAGLLVKGIRSPTVPVGEERLRICLHAFNTGEEIDLLVSTLAGLLKP